MFQTTQIEHADTTISATAHEYINTVSAEADVEDFLVVGD
jgi:hypothetical protein